MFSKSFSAFIILAALPLLAKAEPLGQTLTCYPSYQVNYKKFPQEVGLISRLILSESTEGIEQDTDNIFGAIKIDLDRMNSGKEGYSSWQYARLMPSSEHSDKPVDIAFGPIYSREMKAGNLSRIQIYIGHAKNESVGQGFGKKRLTGLEATKARVKSAPYDGLYFSEVNVEVGLAPDSFARIELPSLNAGLRNINLECNVK